MKIRPLFNKYQRLILKFANTSFGRSYLQAENLPIVRVAPDGIYYKVDDEYTKAVFHPKSPYLNKFDLALKGLETANIAGQIARKYFIDRPEYIIAHFQGLTSVGFLPLIPSLIYYPDAHPETSSVDGNVEHDAGADTSFTTLVNAAGSAATDTATTGRFCYWLDRASVTKWEEIERAIFLFDASSLDDGITIASATLALRGTGKSNSDGSVPSLNIFSSAPASDTSLVAGDYNGGGLAPGSTTFSTRIDYNDWSTSGYNDFELNASGIANISLTAVSKFGAKDETYDDADSAPPWAGNELSGSFTGNFADTASTTADPKLTVLFPSKGGSFIYNLL